jgi:hypothetical protein
MKARELQADLPYFHFVHLMKKGLIKLNDSQKIALSAFGDLWKFTDSLAPYSLHEHEKGRTIKGAAEVRDEPPSAPMVEQARSDG